MSATNNQPLTKKEKYFLKKQRKEQERLGKERKKKTKKTVITLSLAVIGVVLIFLLVNGLSDNPPNNDQGTAKIEINPLEYDAGTVSMAEDKVEYTYKIKNIGEQDLKISNIRTSCMCTTAVLTIGQTTSPKFGMHDNPVFWSQKIAPGQTGDLKVVFDQAFHGPQGIGQAVRVIYFLTNDPQNQKAEVKLLANVVP